MERKKEVEPRKCLVQRQKVKEEEVVVEVLLLLLLLLLVLLLLSQVEEEREADIRPSLSSTLILKPLQRNKGHTMLMVGESHPHH